MYPLYEFLAAPKAAAISAAFLFLTSLVSPLFGQSVIDSQERSRNRHMLKVVRDEVKDHYFDKTFRGVDLDAKFNLADERLKVVRTNSEAFHTIAAFLATLGDSHTRFQPPARSAKIEHGWRMQLIGEKCYVVDVMRGSDAERQGLDEGDEIVGIEGIIPTSANFSQLKYIYYSLNPVAEFNLVIRTPAGAIRRLLVNGRRTDLPDVTDLTDYGNTVNRLIRESENWARQNAHRHADFRDDLFIWKMPQFDLPKEKVDDMMGKVSRHKGLIIDLRGNGGGAEETLLRLLGHLFDRDVKIGDLVRRNESKALVAKTVGDRSYKGRVLVLIDSDSASASEVLAYVIQQNRRGIVIGDRSGGKVMRSRFYPQQTGVGTVVFYGVNVTDADLVMSDGRRLENVGVTPDEIRLPTAQDLKTELDPVLSYAASQLGVELSPQAAGALFPFKWK